MDPDTQTSTKVITEIITRVTKTLGPTVSPWHLYLVGSVGGEQ